ncbi:MAG: hypothetical protein ABSA53_37290 [Streptosporangiaceae bacterium]|jgi:hypothetical protein
MGEAALGVVVADLRRSRRPGGGGGWPPPPRRLAPDQLAGITLAIASLREHTAAPFDLAVALPPGTDPAPYAAAGAPWWLAEFEPETVSLDQVRGVLRDALHDHDEPARDWCWRERSTDECQ